MSYWLRRLLLLSMMVALLASLVTVGGPDDAAAVRALFIISLALSLLGGIVAAACDRCDRRPVRQQRRTPHRDAPSGKHRR